jgi:hypothetical protein
MAGECSPESDSNESIGSKDEDEDKSSVIIDEAGS